MPAQTLAIEVEPLDSITSLDDADGVTKIFFARHDRLDRTLGERAVADFAPARARRSGRFRRR